MLNISLSASWPLEISLLRNLCLAMYPIFKIRSFGLLVSSFLSSLYILDISSLSDVKLVKIFSHFVGCRFVLLMVFFALQNEVPFINC